MSSLNRSSFMITQRARSAKAPKKVDKPNSPLKKARGSPALSRLDSPSARSLLKNSSPSKIAQLFQVNLESASKASIGEISERGWSSYYKTSGFVDKPARSLAIKSELINQRDPLQKLQAEWDQINDSPSIRPFEATEPYIQPVLKACYPRRKPLYEPRIGPGASEKKRMHKARDTKDPFHNFLIENKDKSFPDRRSKPELIRYSLRGVEDRSADNAERRKTAKAFIKEKTEVSAQIREVRRKYFQVKRSETVESQLLSFSKHQWLMMIYFYKVMSQLDAVVDKVIENRRMQVRKNIASRLVIKKGHKNSLSRLSLSYPHWDMRDIQRSKQ